MTTPSRTPATATSPDDEVELLADLTELEQSLVRAARRGAPLDCRRMSMEELAVTADPGQVIRAELIRELLLGRRGELDPRGIHVIGARITGDLDLSHIHAQAVLRVRRSVLDRPCALVYARLPLLDLAGSHVTEVDADGLQVDGNLLLGRGFRASGSSSRGTVRLLGAHIHGTLNMGGAELTNTTGPALHADRLRVDGGVFLRDGFRATGSGDRGTVRLLGAHIHGNLEMNGAELTNTTGPTLNAASLQVDGNVFLRDGFRATGGSDRGTVRLLGAHIHRNLDMNGAELTNTTGPALDADRLRVDGSVFLRNGFRATGSSKQGTVNLVGAHLNGDLNMDGAELTNTTGPALYANSLRVDGNTLLGNGFRATGSGDLGTVHLRGATIHRQLGMDNATVTRNDPGQIVKLGLGTVGDLLLPPTLVCPDGAATTTACGHTDRQVDLAHLTYTTQRRGSWRQWLHLLRHHTRTYTAQPYQQLAAAERAQGHDGPARRILIAQQDDLRHRGQLGSRPTRLVHWAWGKLAGYGYRTGRLIAALLLAITTAGALGILAGHTPIRDNRNVAAHTIRAEHPHTPCSITEQIGLGIDRGLPLGATGLRDRCDLDTTSHRGQAITIAIWAVQAMVWALATLAIAGYTGLIRKIS